MSTFAVIVLLYIAFFGRIYYVLYVQTDEGLEPAIAHRRQRARRCLWEQLVRFKPNLPIPKQERLDAQRLERIRLNVECITEWRLATEEELADYDVSHLQARLDSRNLRSDQIFALLCELDDPVNRSHQRQTEIGEEILRLRMAPLRDLEEQSDARVREILTRHG